MCHLFLSKKNFFGHITPEACRILVLRPGIEPHDPCSGGWSLNHGPPGKSLHPWEKKAHVSPFFPFPLLSHFHPRTRRAGEQAGEERAGMRDQDAGEEEMMRALNKMKDKLA